MRSLFFEAQHPLPLVYVGLQLGLVQSRALGGGDLEHGLTQLKESNQFLFHALLTGFCSTAR